MTPEQEKAIIFIAEMKLNLNAPVTNGAIADWCIEYAKQEQARMLEAQIKYFQGFQQQYQEDYQKHKHDFDRGNARAYQLVVRKLEEELSKLKQK
jgi:hypothetical protein